ncbi:helix-turn-helix domain-containing protein [Bacillus suaedaesalsae]|uniref:Helix-turn-helix domain-containing protein n=1 Tax=Bacillus suaedaesalsae TaxID=2810349 RepID=A0ABS2DNH2_9BACI|nr:helix-turn-helix domain-containing protein [Bacillus suaedaesalsae]
MNGKKIQDLRTKKGMTLSELSKVSGVSKSYLSFIERGIQKNPSIDVIERLAAALEVQPHVIYSKITKPQLSLKELDQEVIELAIEMSKANINKEKLKQLIEILK